MFKIDILQSKVITFTEHKIMTISALIKSKLCCRKPQVISKKVSNFFELELLTLYSVDGNKTSAQEIKFSLNQI